MLQNITIRLSRVWFFSLLAGLITEIYSLRIQIAQESLLKESLVRRSNPNNFTFLNVTRHDDGILYLAYYFPQWHLVPENKLQGKYYTDWDFVKTNSHSFTPTEYYEMNHETLTKHDDMANKFRVGAFIFWHYWIDNAMVLNHPVELFMQRARKTKFMISWDDQSGYLGTQKFDSPERHAYQLLRYFTHENYLTDKDGRKPFTIYLTTVPQDYLNRFSAFLELYNVTLKIGFNWQSYMNNWDIPKSSQICAEFGPHSHPRFADYKVMRNNCSDHWQGTLTSWDARPRACAGRSHHACKKNIPKDQQPSLDLWKQRLKTIKANIAPNNKDRIVSIHAWNEWSEGGVLECSVEYKCKFLEALR